MTSAPSENRDGFGEQAVQRERLVLATRHQAFQHEASDLLHREAADDQRIEAVEGAEHALHQPAALRGVGIDVGHLGEGRRQRRSPMHRDRMQGFRAGIVATRGNRRKYCCEADGGESEASDHALKDPGG